jgi:hypothetical protein
MTGIPSSLQKRLSEGYSFSFGDYISKGFNLFQREIGLFIAAFLLFMLIQIALGFIPIVGGLISGFLVAPIVIVGFYIVGQKLDNEEKIELGDFFKGFEKIGTWRSPRCCNSWSSWRPSCPV